MHLSIIGTGYVGLVTGACFADVGHHVICVDSDREKVRRLQAGEIPIYEPGLEALVRRTVAAGRLSFTASTAEGVAGSEAVFIAVPTPPQPDGSVDLSFIEGVAREIAGCLSGYRVIVDKSTVPVKTAEKVAETVKRYRKTDADFDVVSNPEFLREGFAIDDLMKPDRVVIGTSSERAAAKMREIYEPFGAPVIVTDTNSAELIKHAANSFLALKISYANALSVICEASGANVQEVTRGMGLDARVLPEGLERLHQDQRAVGLRLPPAQGGAAHQRLPDGALPPEDHRHAVGAEGEAHRGAGADLQAEHRRRAQFAGDRPLPPDAGRWRTVAGA